MSSVDLVLLGFLMDGPRSAYDIRKMVAFRNLSNWVKISAPSVYKKILVLEERGLVAGTTLREGNMPEKTVYSITPAGKRYFASLMKDMSSAPIPVLFDFNAVIANLAKLPPKEAGARLAEIKAGIERGRAYVAEFIPLRRDIPIEGQSILRQQLMVYDSLLAWIDEYKGLLAKKKA